MDHEGIWIQWTKTFNLNSMDKPKNLNPGIDLEAGVISYT